MVNASGFDILSRKVSTLIDSYDELKDVNEKLAKKLSEYEKERKKTKTGIDKIITKIEELEVG